jgi:signal transduction histidine kinase/DNA-binding response OmpR family regulator
MAAGLAYGALGYLPILLLNAAAALGLLGLSWRAGRSLLLHGAGALNFACVLLNAALIGRQQAPVLWLLAPLPFLAAYTLPRAGARAWLAVVLASLVAMQLAGPHLPLPAALTPGPREILICQLTLTILLFFVATLARHAQEADARALQDQDQVLQDQTRALLAISREKGEQAAALAVARDEAVRMVQQLELARQEATALSQAKDQFLANMSHELRTPLNAVLGMADLLRETGLSDVQQEHLAILEESGRALLASLGDLLDMHKIEAGEIAPELHAFPLVPCLQDALAVATERALRKGLDLRLQLDPGLPEEIVSDQLRLQQILGHLVDNAVKFTERGFIELRATAAPLEADRVALQIELRDTGIGIPDDRLSRLFQPFVQLDASTTRKYGGSGLGLAICKALAELLGGHLTVRSQEGLGSYFTLSLPVEGRAARGSNPGEESEEGEGTGRVLLVEDNPLNRRVLLRFLEKRGFSADIALDGEAALTKLFTERYDAVLLDVNLPLLDGYQVATALREHRQERRPYLIGITANALPGDREKCIAAGMDEYLTKPVDLDALARLLSRRSSRASRHTLSPGSILDPLLIQQARREERTRLLLQQACEEFLDLSPRWQGYLRALSPGNIPNNAELLDRFETLAQRVGAAPLAAAIQRFRRPTDEEHPLDLATLPLLLQLSVRTTTAVAHLQQSLARRVARPHAG